MTDSEWCKDCISNDGHWWVTESSPEKSTNTTDGIIVNWTLYWSYLTDMNWGESVWNNLRAHKHLDRSFFLLSSSFCCHTKPIRDYSLPRFVPNPNFENPDPGSPKPQTQISTTNFYSIAILQVRVVLLMFPSQQGQTFMDTSNI